MNKLIPEKIDCSTLENYVVTNDDIIAKMVHKVEIDKLNEIIAITVYKNNIFTFWKKCNTIKNSWHCFNPKKNHGWYISTESFDKVISNPFYEVKIIWRIGDDLNKLADDLKNIYFVTHVDFE